MYYILYGPLIVLISTHVDDYMVDTNDDNEADEYEFGFRWKF